jgi:hypothetical protein
MRLRNYLSGVSRGNIKFIVAFAIFLAAQTSLTALPMTAREVPVEADDAYNLILKAEQIYAGCLLQECDSLEMLRQQIFSPDPDPSISFTRMRVYQRTFLVYNPLHSSLLVLLKHSGLSYEDAFNVVAVAGKMLISFGIGLWLLAIFGKTTTAISLLLLAPAIFGGQGIEIVWPSSISLGLALILWALILSRSRLLNKTFVWIVLIMILFHPIGKIFATASIGLLVLERGKTLNKKTAILLLAITLIVSISFILPAIIERPELEIPASYFFPQQGGILDALFQEEFSPFQTFEFWAGAFPSSGIAIAILLLSVAFLINESKKTVWITALMLLSLFLLGAIYSVPVVGRVLLDRVVVPIEIFLTGLFAHSIAMSIRLILSIINQSKKTYVQRSYGLRFKNWQRVILLLSFSIIIILLQQYYSHHLKHFQLTLNESTTDQDISFNSEQVSLIENTNPGLAVPAVLYFEETPMYMYLSYGAADYGALYYGARGSQPESKDEFAHQLQSVTHTVHKNPLHGFNHRGQLVGLLVDEQSVLRIAPNINHFAPTYDLLISNVDEGDQGEIVAKWSESGEVHTITIPIAAGPAQWVSLPIKPSSLDYVELTSGSWRELIIQGIRLSSKSKTLWPWEEDLEITTSSQGLQTRRLVLGEGLLTAELAVNIEVLDDHGFTILTVVTNP